MRKLTATGVITEMVDIINKGEVAGLNVTIRTGWTTPTEKFPNVLPLTLRIPVWGSNKSSIVTNEFHRLGHHNFSIMVSGDARVETYEKDGVTRASLSFGSVDYIIPMSDFNQADVVAQAPIAPAVAQPIQAPAQPTFAPQGNAFAAQGNAFAAQGPVQQPIIGAGGAWGPGNFQNQAVYTPQNTPTQPLGGGNPTNPNDPLDNAPWTLNI